jgi:predicted RNA-binding protein with PIN domain
VPWLLDGNNLARGGDREAVRRAALVVARNERLRIVVFFDGQPPAGGSDAETLGRVEVRYAPHADTAIVGFLRGRGRGWKVATDDRALAMAVRRAGAEAVPAASFWRKVATAPRVPPRMETPVADTREEMAFLSDPRNRLPARSASVRASRQRAGRRKR